MQTGGNSDQLMSEINVTPFVDVMLVLLIIFMVTAPMMVQGVDVALPEAEAGSMDTDEKQLTISIDKENRIFINDRQIPLNELGVKLAAIADENKKAGEKAFLRADKSVPYGMVVNVMSVIKTAGIEKLGIITDTPQE